MKLSKMLQNAESVWHIANSEYILVDAKVIMIMHRMALMSPYPAVSP